MAENSPHYCKGNGLLKVALIFSTPGRFEESKGMPVSGQTGENLKAVIKELKSRGYFKKYNCIYDFRITNATKSIEYKKKTGRTESPKRKILSECNLNRLFEDIKDIEEFIICFGKKSQIAIEAIKDKLNPNVKIIKVPHLSPLSFNKIKGTSNYNERVDFICNEIINQIKTTAKIT
jgi:pyruvate/2-oxoacid:ferredoxin oxidoreductase alpha subunit